MSKYISGEEILHKAGIRTIEFLNYIVNKDLQPYDQFGKPIPPPDVKWCQEEIDKYQTNKFIINIEIGSLDTEIQRLEQNIDYYQAKKNPPPKPIDRCTHFILEKTSERKELTIEDTTLKNKIEIYSENLNICRKRNAKKNLLSWENFDLHSLSPEMLGYNPDEFKGGILEQISSPNTLYLRTEVQEIFDFESQKQLAESIPNDQFKTTVFPCPPGTKLKWKDIKITLISKDVVNIETPLGPRRFSYHELDMADKRTRLKKPTVLWGLLKMFAEHHGFISSQNPKYDPNLPDTAKRLNRCLQDFFGIYDSIFTDHYKAEKGYKTKIFFSDKTKVV